MRDSYESILAEIVFWYSHAEPRLVVVPCEGAGWPLMCKKADEPTTHMQRRLSVHRAAPKGVLLPPSAVSSFATQDTRSQGPDGLL